MSRKSPRWGGLDAALDKDGWEILEELLGTIREPDLIIAPDGVPYLHRWHIVKSKYANCYLHCMTGSDVGPHDHEYHNTSIIISGGYDEEEWAKVGNSWARCPALVRRKPGDVIHRVANMPHRLSLPLEINYSISMFSTSPRIREWGFWVTVDNEPKWVPHTEMVKVENNISVRI